MGYSLPGAEQTIGLIQDVLLPLDAATRYDLYFTDSRIAIVCMGRSDRIENERPYSPLTFVAPTTTTIDHQQKRINRIILEEEVAKLSMDEKLRLSKKSCYYTYDEIEEVKLMLGKKPKFIILSSDCESKFAPTMQQLKQLSVLLPTIDGLRGKLSEAGSWSDLHKTEEGSSSICGCCGFRNDKDAVFCQCCGTKIEPNATAPPELVCFTCGTKNRPPAAYCRNCGTPIKETTENAS